MSNKLFYVPDLHMSLAVYHQFTSPLCHCHHHHHHHHHHHSDIAIRSSFMSLPPYVNASVINSLWAFNTHGKTHNTIDLNFSEYSKKHQQFRLKDSLVRLYICWHPIIIIIVTFITVVITIIIIIIYEVIVSRILRASQSSSSSSSSPSSSSSSSTGYC